MEHGTNNDKIATKVVKKFGNIDILFITKTKEEMEREILNDDIQCMNGDRKRAEEKLE